MMMALHLAVAVLDLRLRRSTKMLVALFSVLFLFLCNGFYISFYVDVMEALKLFCC